MERDLLRQVEDFSFSRLNSSFGCHTTMKIMLFIDFLCVSAVCVEKVKVQRRTSTEPVITK